jgi:hypothetical protein
MNITGTGLFSFVIWTALSAFCFVIATGLARFIAPPPRNAYVSRLVLMFLILIIWWLCVPLTAAAYIGNSADPKDANRRGKWEAKQEARLYGAHTIWPWCLVALLHRPKGKPQEVRSC